MVLFLQQNAPEIENQEEFLEVARAALMLPTELPEPHAPRGRKRDLYHDPSVFDELDNDVVMVSCDVVLVGPTSVMSESEDIDNSFMYLKMNSSVIYSVFYRQ